MKEYNRLPFEVIDDLIKDLKEENAKLKAEIEYLDESNRESS